MTRKFDITLLLALILFQPIECLALESAEPKTKNLAKSVCTLSGKSDYPLQTAFAEKFPDSVCWCPSKEPQGKIEIQGGLGKDGRIYDLQVWGNTGLDPQSNAECFEAVASSAPFTDIPESGGKLFSIISVFDKNRPFHQAKEIDRYFADHPDAKDNSVVIHRIPVSVLKKYPTALKKEEIFSVRNLVAIRFKPEHLKISDKYYVDPILSYYSEWSDFFLSHQNATSKQLEEAANSIWERCSLAFHLNE